VHLADITFVKLVLPRLAVYTNTRCVTFHCTDAAKLREMSSRIKGELSCAQLRSWFDKSANLKLRDDHSDPATLLRSESRDRVVGPNEKRELQASIEALPSRSSDAAAPQHPHQSTASPTVVLDNSADLVTSPRQRRAGAAASSSDADDAAGSPVSRGSKTKEDRTCQSCRKQKAKMRVETTDSAGVQRSMLLCRSCFAELQPTNEHSDASASAANSSASAPSAASGSTTSASGKQR
jgi:hypothetical protein